MITRERPGSASGAFWERFALIMGAFGSAL